MRQNIKKIKRLKELLEKYTNKKMYFVEKESTLPSFLSYDNLFSSHELNEDEDEETITKPKTKPPVTKPKPKRPSPLTPTHPVTNPKPKSMHERCDRY